MAGWGDPGDGMGGWFDDFPPPPIDESTFLADDGGGGTPDDPTEEAELESALIQWAASDYGPDEFPLTNPDGTALSQAEQDALQADLISMVTNGYVPDATFGTTTIPGTGSSSGATGSGSSSGGPGISLGSGGGSGGGGSKGGGGSSSGSQTQSGLNLCAMFPWLPFCPTTTRSPAANQAAQASAASTFFSPSFAVLAVIAAAFIMRRK